MDPITLITAITGLVSALAGTGLFVRRRRKRKRARAAAAAASSVHASKIAAVGTPPPYERLREPGDDG